ncbi:MAG: penicillin acylase family protein [Actinomycetota bacterium]|nr:penicillin acylase family protein [Actinomycetota bacterium]
MRRFLTALAVFLSVVLIAGAIFAVVTTRKSYPETSGEVTLSGLHGKVDIKRDDKGIPQVYADDPEDLFFAQGYAHAQDRFFEMDFRRHVTSGRLAELFGKSALDTDKVVRTMGWRRVAEQELAKLDDKTKRLLTSYAQGVNSYIEGKSSSKLSLEYAVLSLTGPDYRPEPWQPADSLAWIKAMAWDLRSNMSDEITRTLSTAKLTPDQVNELYPAMPAFNKPIVGEGSVQNGKFSTAKPCPDPLTCPQGTGTLSAAAIASLESAGKAADKLPALLGAGEGIGSNSWVVDGDHSSTGKPILSNDPHLAPSMPGIWYEVGLHCRKVSAACPYDVAGFSFSGLPGVVVGHNNKIAWGVTTMYADVADLYLERITGNTYEYDGKQRPLTTRKEKFKVKDGKTRTITVRSTRHGPIISDVDDELADVGEEAVVPGTTGNYAVALKWTALAPEPTIKAIFALDTAQNWDDFRAAAKLFTVPSQNLIYADKAGNIGYQAPGTIPIRGKGDGRWPVPGWDPDYEWKGAIPFEQLPSVLNPGEGFIVTANQEVIGDQYAPNLGKDAAAGYRSQRIRDLLEKKPKLSVADMSELQLDKYSPNAKQLVPLLLKIPLEESYYRQGQNQLRGWDFQQTADSGAAAYFNAVWRNLLKLTFHDELPKSQWPDGGERWFNVARTILKDPTSHWWDDVTTSNKVESRDEILAQSMQDARDELTMKQSRDPHKWAWGKFHKLTLVNPTLGDSGVGLINSLFNRGPYEVGGGGGIVDATAWDATEGYEVTAIPSMRMVVDLANLNRSRWIQLTGNSGHAFHRNYVDQTEMWLKGETMPWAFTRAAVDKSTEDTLTLRPDASN